MLSWLLTGVERGAEGRLNMKNAIARALGITPVTPKDPPALRFNGDFNLNNRLLTFAYDGDGGYTTCVGISSR